MFNSPVIDLVILLSFTYFIGSIMLTTINEAITSSLKTRAKDLESAIKKLLLEDNPEKSEWSKYVTETLFKSQYIKSLMKENDKLPSYIPSRNFLLALIEEIKGENYSSTNIIIGINNSALPSSMKNVLLTIWAKANANATSIKSNISIFEEEVEAFYNNAMERATGWYKRKTRLITLIVGFLLAASMNIDTIKITNDSLINKQQLANTVDKIIENLPSISVTDSVTIKNGKDSILIKQIITQKKDTTTVDTTKKGNLDMSNIYINSTKTVKELQVVYNNTGGYQMGYADKNQFAKEWFGLANDEWYNALGIFLLKILGLLLTAFALQLGSGYWFDVLNKAVNIRASGKKPEEKK